MLTIHGETIWTRVRAKLQRLGGEVDWFSDPRQAVVVTTYGREDMQFQTFFQRWSAINNIRVEMAFIPRSDSIESDFPYFLPHDVRTRLEGRSVLLLLSSMHTSEKLRKLVSLLAQSGVARITVLCLLNRMGKRTVDFVSRIERLAQGLGRDDLGRNFAFVHVFNINDLHGAQLNRTLQAVEALAADYCDRTPSPTYKSLTLRELRYFQTVPIAQLESHQVVGRSLEDAIGRRVPEEDRDAWLYKLISTFVSTREAGGLVSALDDTPDRRALYILFTCLLSETSYLRLTGTFQNVKECLIGFVRRSRRKRFDLEKALNGRRAGKAEATMMTRSMVAQETDLLFGLALFSYLDHDSESYSELAKELLATPPEVSNWAERPLNFELTVGADRYLWCVSLLLHFTRPDYRSSAPRSSDGASV